MANFSLTYQSKREIARDTWEFIFSKPEDFVFEAGQYVALVLPRLVVPDSRGPVRSLSIASAPCESDLCFTMRLSESGYKQTIMTLEPGEVAQATKPIGHFTLSNASDGRRIVFLVGGIGVTPMRSILVQAVHDHLDRPFVAFYSNRQIGDAAYHEELKKLELSSYHYIPTFTQEMTPCVGGDEERGYICEGMLRKYLPRDDITGNWYYLVGGPVFIEAMEKMLGEMGVAKERCISDPFTGLVSASQKK